MPEKKTIERARKAKRQGKAPTTQAGAFVREEMHHARDGKHPVRSRRQAIAIGLSKARKSGVGVPARGASKGKKKSATARPAKSAPRKSSGGKSPRTAAARKKSAR